MQIYDGRDDKKAAPTNDTANVISAGRCLCPSTDHMTIRRNGRADWSLFYCESGIMSFDDQKVIPRQVWIYPPNVSKYAAMLKVSVSRFNHDTALSVKYVNDEESAEMLDFVFANTVCEFSYMFQGNWGAEIALSVGLNENYASWYAQKMPPPYSKRLATMITDILKFEY